MKSRIDNSKTGIAGVSANEYLQAAAHGDLPVVVQYIAENKNNPEAMNVKGDFGIGALQEAVRQGHQSVVDALLAVENLDVNATNSMGETVLHVAVVQGSNEIEKLLKRKDLRLDVYNHFGITPLMAAIDRGKDTIAIALLNRGAKPQMHQLDDYIDRAIARCSGEVVKKLQSCKAPQKKISTVMMFAHNDKIITTQPSKITHEPARWATQSATDKGVWNYFDNEVTKLVRSALQHHDLTLSSLYHALARLRGKIENVKESDWKEKDLQLAANLPIFDSVDTRSFGVMLSLRLWMCESGPLSKEWGDDVHVLVKKRLAAGIRNVGLSRYKDDMLSHRPPYQVLQKLQPCFQNLLAATDVFAFVMHAQQLIFQLSNYQLLKHGSAAVNAWIIDKIFQERFGSHLSMPVSIRPHLQDWHAFFETPQVYKTYYVVTAAANLLLSYEEFLDRDTLNELNNVHEVMFENPYQDGNMEKRNALWNKIRGAVAVLAKNTNIPEYDRRQLNSLDQHLEFMQASPQVKHIISLLDDFRNDFRSACRKLTSDDFSCIHKLILFYRRFQSDGFNPIDISEEEYAQIWFDMETLWCALVCYYKNETGFTAKSRSVKDYQFNILWDKFIVEFTGIEICTSNNKCEVDYKYIDERLAGASFMTEDEAQGLPMHVVDLLKSNNSAGIKKAVVSGGLRIQDMANYTDEQISILTHPCALLLYHANMFIRACDLVDESPVLMKEKIVRKLALIYGNEELPEKFDSDIVWNKPLPEASLIAGTFKISTMLERFPSAAFTITDHSVFHNQSINVMHPLPDGVRLSAASTK